MVFSSTLQSVLATLLLFLAISPVRSFWIISHHPLVSQRLDPIVAPNGISAHTHTFVGSASIQPSQSVDTTCTTSPVKADKSKYWAPQLYYYHGDTDTFDSVPLNFVNTYYLNRGGPTMGEDPSKLKPYPKGFKMIAGDATLYDAPNSDATKAKAISYVCLGTDGPQTTTLPAGPCPGGIRTQIVFPSCWNGVDLDSANHASHVAYPINGNPDTGDCPSTHPIKFMTLFYEFIYNTGSLQAVSNGTSSSGFVLANGDAVGNSFHADFVSGWDETVLSQAITSCSGNLFGDLASCAPFKPTLHFETTTPSSDAAAGYCRTAASVDETVLGNGLASLPGCQTVRNGPFKGAGLPCGATTPTSSSMPKSLTPTDPAYQGCYQEPTGGRALPNSVTVKGGNTISGCRAACSAAGFSVAGAEYGAECWCNNGLGSGSKKVSDDFCSMPCAGKADETCGGPSLLSVYSTDAVKTLPATSIPTTVGTSAYQGCYLEASGARLLDGASFANKSTTPGVCAAFCSAKGFQYSGTEYSSECYCGSRITTAKTADADCSMKCAGDSTAFCGGSSRVQVYKDNNWKQSFFTVMQSGQWNFTDCAVDSGPRLLPTAVSAGGKAMTVQSCLNACQAKGFKYCGMEYSGECYASNTLPTTWKPAPAVKGLTDPVSRGCKMPCVGDSTLACGGSSRLSLYTLFADAPATRPVVLA
ncbi:unnamed protein product [Sympodiomycopsis kandeliae]